MFREIFKLLRRDGLLEQALQSCFEMLDLCGSMVHKAVDSLRNRDEAHPATDVYELDKKLNHFEREVRRKVLTHLALGNPADGAAAVTLVSVVIDIERIGDYCKNICDLARDHADRLDVREHEADLKEIETAALGLFERTVPAFRTGDTDAARQLMQVYKEDVSRHCREVEERLVRGETSLPASEAVTLALYVRFLKRISAHSKNLVSSIVNPVERIGYGE